MHYKMSLFTDIVVKAYIGRIEDKATPVCSEGSWEMKGKCDHVPGHGLKMLPNSSLKPSSLSHHTYEQVFLPLWRPLSVDGGRGLRWSQSPEDASGVCLLARPPTTLATISPRFPNTRNSKPLLAIFPPTRHWAFVSCNEHGAFWKYALCSTKGDRHIIRNDSIPALQRGRCY